MSWSFQIANGDLTLGNASYGTVTGEQKLVQDLRAYILEKMGTDDMHPTYGSTINGGRLADGTEVQGSIGIANNALALAEVESEIRRIASDYQARQLQRAKDDRITYGKVTLTKGEVLLGIGNIDVKQYADTLDLTITLNTGNNTEVELDLLLE